MTWISDFLSSVFSGQAWRAVTGVFSRIQAYFIVLGILIFVIRFFYGMLKKEFQNMEDIFNYIAISFGRLVIVFIFAMPINLAGIVNTGNMPLGLYMYFYGAYVGYNTAGLITQEYAGVTPDALPSIWKEIVNNSVNSAIGVVDSSMSEYNPETGGLASGDAMIRPEGGSFWGKFFFGLLSVVGAVVGTFVAPGAGTLVGLKIGALLGLITDAFVSGFDNIIAQLRLFLVMLLVPISITTTYIGVFLIIILKFALLAPFFYFSIFYLFFESGRQVFYSNLRKWLGMLFYPSALVLAFMFTSEAFMFLIRFFESDAGERLFESVVSSNGILGAIQIIIASLVSVGLFTGTLVTLIRAATNFVDSMLGSTTIVTYQGKH